MSDVFRVDVGAQLDDEYDVVVVGGGPAGLSAGIYAVRAGMKTCVLTREHGGQVANAPKIENYLGFSSISGPELAERFLQHAESAGVSMVPATVLTLKKEGNVFVVETDRGTTRARAVVLATGTRRRELGVPGEKELKGRGVSYCALCDAPLFKGKIVAVVGGGNTALADAEHLAEHAERVYVIHRRSEFRADKKMVERIRGIENVEFVLDTVVVEILGEERVTGIRVENVKTGEERVLPVDGVFIAVGLQPVSDLALMVGAKVDDAGYVVVNERMETSVPGLFAAGDVSTGMAGVHQIVTAAAAGAIAALSARAYVRK